MACTARYRYVVHRWDNDGWYRCHGRFARPIDAYRWLGLLQQLAPNDQFRVRRIVAFR